MEVSKREEIPDQTTIDVVVRPDIGVSSTRDHWLQDRIRSAIAPVVVLEQHPRTLIQIVVQIVQSGGLRFLNSTSLSASINATYMALLDAGVPLRSTVSACSVVCTDDKSYVDPDKKTLEHISSNIRSVHTIAYEVKGGQIERLLMSESVGSTTPDQIFECFALAAATCIKVNETMRTVMSKAIDRRNRWRT
ncbi:hypothetical protein V1512DRAFT_202020 [Lipomyces arxii]|uniref:uncharacterized protein n=1 Tax=Lipomyces arxii TaxID=56418 RepID=UPI0034CE4707